MNEGQARELRRCKNPEMRVEQWKTVLKAAGDQPITAKFIRLTLRSSPPHAGSSDQVVLQIKACLDRIRGLVIDSPNKSSALNLIATLEQILSAAAEVVTT